jgi:hypothetical protein
MTNSKHQPSSCRKALTAVFMAAQLAACGGGTGSDNASEVLPSEVLLPADVAPSSVTIAWTAPVARADGSPLSLAEIGGYRIYYGNRQGDYPNRVDVNDGTAVESTLNGLAEGTYYIVVTTYDTAGRESEFSPVVIKTL